MALLQFYYFVLKALDKKEFCIGLFIDLSKAFDTLNPNILLDVTQNIRI